MSLSLHMCNNKIVIAHEVDLNIWAQMWGSNLHKWEEYNTKSTAELLTATTTIC